MPCRSIELRSVKPLWIGSQPLNAMDAEKLDILSQIALTQIKKDKTLERVKQNLKENQAEGSTHDTKGKEKENTSEHWKMTKMSMYS